MKIPCDIIKDLLPLYNDGVCSKESVNAVEEHLTDCPDCTKELEKIKENSPADMLKKEENDIIGTFRKSNLKKLLFFGVCLVIFPVINLLFTLSFAENYVAKKVFFITVLVMLNSVVLPAVVRKNRKLVIMISSLAAPLAVFWVKGIDISIFFNIDLLFNLPALVYFWLSGAFIPLKIRVDCDSPLRYKKAGLRLAAMETALLIPLSIKLPLMYIADLENLRFNTFCYSVPFLILIWGIVLLNRFLKSNRYIKASIYTALVGIYLGTFSIFEYCASYSWRQSDNKYFFWQANLIFPHPKNAVANISLFVLILFFAVAAVLFAIGKQKDKKIPETNSQTIE